LGSHIICSEKREKFKVLILMMYSKLIEYLSVNNALQSLDWDVDYNSTNGEKTP